MLLADEYWLLAYDDRTGKPRVSGGMRGLGLAAALIGELIPDGNVVVQNGYLHARARELPPDRLSHDVLAQMLAEPQRHPIRAWLLFLGRTAHDAVAERLVGQEILRPRTSRKLLKQLVTYEPLDANRVAWPMARLATALRRQSPVDEPDAVLTGLAAATGLDQLMLRGAEPAAKEYLAYVVSTLSTPYHTLVKHTEAVVGDTVLSRRV